MLATNIIEYETLSPRIEIFADFRPGSLFGEGGRVIARRLLSENFQVRLFPLNDSASFLDSELHALQHTFLDESRTIIRLVMGPPQPLFEINRYLILFTALESRSLHKRVVPRLRTADEIWTPSSYYAGFFRAYLQDPIHISIQPLGVHVDSRGASRKSPERPFTAFSSFEWSWRKAPDLLLRSWFKAFRKDDPVKLIIHTTHPEPDKAKRDALIQQEIQTAGLQSGNRRPPAVEWVRRPLSAAEWLSYCRQSDVFVLPTRGEGWCSEALQAMACGSVPVITATHGVMDFCDKKNSFLLKPGKPIVAPRRLAEQSDFYIDQRFDNPVDDDLVKRLQQAFRNRRLVEKKRGRGLADVERLWSWDVVLDSVVRRLLLIDEKLKKNAPLRVTS